MVTCARVVLLLVLSLPGPVLAQFGTPPPTRPVVLLNGHLVPVEQFWVAFPDVCPTLHVHAAFGGTVIALDGTVIPDPAAGACGYGIFLRVFEVFVTDLPDADFDGLPDSEDPAPNDPDGDGDLVPDGNEDGDGDKLNVAQEFWLSRTSDATADSDGDNLNDRVEYVFETRSREFVTIPVIANVYAGSGATEPHVRDAITQANLILAQARLRFELVDVRSGVTDGDDGSGGGTAGDGVFTEPEGYKVFDNGVKEVAELPGKKGFKVNFGQAGGLLPGSTTPGLSLHRVGSVLCVQRGNAALTGSTIAHELFHAMTLKHPTGAVPENTPGNVMTPSNAGRDAFVTSADPDKGIANVTLTPGQIVQIIDDGVGAQLGTTATRRSPAQKKHYESTLATDPAGDHGAADDWLDLRQLQLASDEDQDDIHVLLSVAAPLPDAGAHTVVYSLLFDADADTGTGSTVEGFAGVDVEVQLVFQHTDADGLLPASRAYLHPGAQRQLLPQAPVVHPVLRRADDASVSDTSASDLVEVRLPKAAVALLADDVPVHVVAKATEFAAAADVLTTTYERTRWASDPTLALPREYALAGDSVGYSLNGMAPGAAFELRFDDTVVASGTLDGSGAASGSFTVPAVPEGFHFVTARDSALHVASSGLVLQVEVFADGFEGD